jgi:hypothetical protein
MAAGGFKTFVAGEILTAADTNDYLMQGVLVFAGTAARGSAIPSPVEGQFSFRTDDDILEFYDGSDWVEFSTSGYAEGTGGQGTATSGGFRYHKFTANGNFVATKDGAIELLMVAGGGGGGRGNNEPAVLNASAGGGGGGAGGLVWAERVAVTAGTTYPIVVGAGGAGGAADLAPGATGQDSTGFGLTAKGGGGGGTYANAAGTTGNGQDGASSGGAGGSNAFDNRGRAVPGLVVAQAYQRGNAGGASNCTISNAGGASSLRDGGGGGGAATRGGDGTLPATNIAAPGAGGDGISFSAWATATSTGDLGFYAGGGGGGDRGGQGGGAGGAGGGANGGSNATAGGNANTNTGGGGGGSGSNDNVNGGSGGSGIVLVRYAV